MLLLEHIIVAVLQVAHVVVGAGVARALGLLLANVDIAINGQTGDAFEQCRAKVALHAKPPLVAATTAARGDHEGEEADVERREDVHVREGRVLVQAESEQHLESNHWNDN